jgi:integrase/recombinase XerD
MEEILKEYETFLNKFSKSTRHSYMIYARGFLAYLFKRGIQLYEANEKAIEGYTGNDRYRKTGIRRFMSFIHNEEFVPLVMRKKVDTKLNPALGSLLNSYIRHIRAKGVSERTIKITHSHIRRFLEYLEENGITEIARVKKNVISDYSLYLLLYRVKDGDQVRPYNATTRSNILMQVRKFFDFLRREKIVLTNPADEIPLPKLPKTISREVPDLDEVDRILGSIDKDSAAGLRNYAIIETLYSTGLRSPELVRLKLDDIDLENRFLTVRKGKYGKPRTVPASNAAFYALSEYIEKSRPRIASRQALDEGWVFLNIKDGKKLTNHGIVEVVKACAEKAGIKKHLIPHSFRYACATHMLRNGADIRFIQEMLGHESIHTTQLYTRVVKGDLKRVIRRFHPRETDFIEDSRHE